MKIKLCGIRRFEDISYVNEFKPDYIGFVFAQSKRQISADFAAKLKAKLDGGIKTVGIFVNSSLKETAHTAEKAGLDVIQLHGDENESFIYRYCMLRTRGARISGQGSGRRSSRGRNRCRYRRFL